MLPELQKDLECSHGYPPYKMDKDFAPPHVFLTIGPGKEDAVCSMKDRVDNLVLSYKERSLAPPRPPSDLPVVLTASCAESVMPPPLLQGSTSGSSNCSPA